MTWEQSVQYAAGKGVVLTPELKSEGFTLDLVAEDMVSIFGRFRPQAREGNQVAGWAVKPSQIWGPVIARRWIR